MHLICTKYQELSEYLWPILLTFEPFEARTTSGYSPVSLIPYQDKIRKMGIELR